MRSVRFVTATVAVLIAMTAVAPAAAAHGTGSGGPTNIASKVDAIEPAVPGLSVRILDMSSRVELRDTGTHTIVVLGYQGEPYLRVDQDGAWENVRSPAVALNATANATVGTAGTDAAAAPTWKQLGPDRQVRWHDHRAHWMATILPAEVHDAPDHPHVLALWELPLLVDGHDATIRGRIVWSPAPIVSRWWLATAGLCAATLVLLHVVGRLRRTLAIAVFAIAAVAAVGLAVTYGFAPAMTGSAVARVLTRAIPTLVPCLGFATGAWWLLRGRLGDGWLFACVASIFLTLVAGVARTAVFGRAHLDAAGPANLTRVLVVLVIGCGSAIAVAAAVEAWRFRPSVRSRAAATPP